MAKTLYSATMSLDGYIAGPGGDMSWLSEHLDPNPHLDSLPEQVGSVLVGARTFFGDDPNAGTDAEGAFGGTWHGPVFVLTHRPPKEPVEGVESSDDLHGALARAKEAAGAKYVNVLGSDVARQCLAAGELDEVLVVVAPVLLGDGTRLLAMPGRAPVRLETVSVTTAPSATNLWMRVGRRD